MTEPMNSFNKFNYELRPAKFAERRMLLSSLQEICNKIGLDKYDYIGLSSPFYTDFKLFHKELHINNLVSIEGSQIENIKDRMEFNRPYKCIEISMGMSTKVLIQQNWKNKKIVWLDYDDSLDMFMFDDIEILFKNLVPKSLYLITCNSQLKRYDKESFKEKFKGLVPFNISNKDFASEYSNLTLRNMFTKHINRIINERNLTLPEDEHLAFYQIYFFKYQENRGARMFTLGGIVDYKNQSFSTSDFNLDRFEFIKTSDVPYEIKVPNLTVREVDFLNQQLPDKTTNLINNMKFLPQEDVENYSKLYKYLPNYLDVRF